MNSFTFRDLYKNMLKTHPEIRLDIHTRHSREIYTMMESHALDIGFVSSLLPVYNIRVRPVYSEPMFVVCSAGNNLDKTIIRISWILPWKCTQDGQMSLKSGTISYGPENSTAFMSALHP